MNNNILVSVLIPMYNSEKYISETLDSCLGQSYTNIEIIIVDDGSTDNSYLIAKKYVDKYNFIKLYKQENAGAPTARNLAFKKSSGDYIQYLDADDLISEDKITRQVELLKHEDNKTISYCQIGRFYKSIENIEWAKNMYHSDFNNPIDFFNSLLSNGWISIHSWLVPRELIIRTGEWRADLTRNQDGEFFGRVILNSKKGLFESQGKVYYRRDNVDSISRKKAGKSYFESTARSYYTSIDFIALNGDNNQKKIVAKRVNGYCERLFLLNSTETEIIQEKLVGLGYSNNECLQHPIVKYFKYIVGYRLALKMKFFILDNLLN